jgi:signal transduction histidine kinase
VERDLRRAARERITLEVEGLNPHTKRYFLNRIYPGIPEGVAIYFHDITQRKLAEDSLREADRRKDQFLATLAHELRNPLAPIRNASRIISLKSPGDPQLKWGAEVIGRQVQHMSRLLDDLLDVSRISRNRLELRKEWSDLATLVESAIETSRPVIESNQHAFRVQLPTPAIYVDADPVRMGQVFSNLLNNAAKYTPAGGQIELSAARDGNDAVVSIKDNGIGIAPDHIDHVFEIFWQDSSAAAHAQGGLGIGLSLAKGLVELHGGQIIVLSAGVGCGAEVRVRLPAVREEVLAVAAPTENSMTASMPQRVLIVDDLKDNADTLSELLRSMGHQAFVAYDGSSAIGLAAKLQPDVILLDIGLPSPDGLEVCRRIRSEPWGKSILIAAVTGWGQEGDRARTSQAGFDRHFTKPVEPALLAQFLQSPARQ